MNQPVQKKPEAAEEQGAIARLGASLADWSEKWFPDAYVFAAIAVFIVAVAALAMGRTPTLMVNAALASMKSEGFSRRPRVL